MRFDDVVEPKNDYISEEGNFDLIIDGCKQEWKNGKEKWDYTCISLYGGKITFSLYPGNEYGRWYMKKLLLSIGFTETQLKGIDLDTSAFVGGVFNVNIVKDEFNGKTFYKPDPKSFKESALTPSEFNINNDEPF